MFSLAKEMSIGKESKGVSITLLVFLALFFALNLYAALTYGNENLLGDFQSYGNDDVKYIRSAWELVNNGSFIYHKVDEPTVFIMPGLTFSLAFFMKFFGFFGGVTAFRVFQAVLQACSLYLGFLIGRRVFNSRVALIACFLNLFYVAEYYAVTMVLTEVLFKFFFLLLIYLALLAVQEKKLSLYLIGGVVWALGCMVRPTIAAYPVVILTMWLVQKYSLQEMVKYTLATTLVFALVMSPWWIRNYLVFQRFIPLTLSTGNPFLQGTYPEYDMTENYMVYELGDNFIQRNENEMAAGIQRLKTYAPQEPLRYLRWYTVGKAWHLWKESFFWKPMFGISMAQATNYHWLILLVSAVGSLWAMLRRKQSFLFLLLTILFTTLIYLPYFTMPRYSWPVMPLVMMGAAYFLYEVLRQSPWRWESVGGNRPDWFKQTRKIR